MKLSNGCTLEGLVHLLLSVRSKETSVKLQQTKNNPERSSSATDPT